MQLSSSYGTDLACMRDAIAVGEGHFNGVALVPLVVGLDDLAELKAGGLARVAFDPAGIDLHY